MLEKLVMREMLLLPIIKEEQPDVPPGFTPQGVCATTFTPSTALNCTSSRGESGPIKLHSVPMQNLIEQGPPLTNSAHCMKRKRKCKNIPGYKIDPISGRRRTLPLSPQAHGSESLFDFNPTIASLKAKHGAIDKDCNLDSEWMRQLNLFGICKMLKDLQKKKLDELNISSLQPYYDILGDVEKLKINVKWLYERLDEIKDAIILRDRAKVLEAAKNEQVKDMEGRKEKLKRLEIEIKNLEDQLATDNMFIEELNREIRNQRSKYEHFQCRPLLDGLV